MFGEPRMISLRSVETRARPPFGAALDGHELVHVVDLKQRDANLTILRGDSCARAGRSGNGEHEQRGERGAEGVRADEWHL